MTAILSYERKETLYERFCHFSLKILGRLVKEPKSTQIEDAIRFSGLRVTLREVFAAAILAAVIAGMFFFVLTLLSIKGIIGIPWFFSGLLTVGVPLGAYAYYIEYPGSYANIYRIRALGTMPEIISNIAISLKLVPNMESAVAFAAGTTRGHMGVLFKRLVWETYSRVYMNTEEAITGLAETWKKYNDDFARSLYLIRTSMEEQREKRRLEVLDLAVDTMLKGASEKMGHYASSLFMPTMIIYFMGIILPLIMVAIMPVLAFTGVSIGSGQLVLVYDILLPIIIFQATSWILLRRPVTVVPPRIEKHPGLPPYGKIRIKIGKRSYFVSGLMIGVVVAAPFFFFGIKRVIELVTAPSLEPFKGAFGIDPTVLVLWGVAIMLFVYFFVTNIERQRLREQILQTEMEFLDGLSQLGNRLFEGKPIEDAIGHVSRVMGGSKVAGIFNRALKNILIGRASVRSAFFDEREGALRFVYSDMIRNVMQKIIEGAEKGPKTASITVFRTVEQLKRVKQIEKEMKNRLDDVVISMKFILVFVGPVVAGVVIVVQKMINSYLLNAKTSPFTSSYRTDVQGLPFEPSRTNVIGEFSQNVIPSGALILIVGVYLVLMVVILSRYITGINHGEDRLAQKIEIGKNVLAAVLLYTFTMGVTGMFLGL